MEEHQDEGILLGSGTILTKNVNEMPIHQSPDFRRLYANMVGIATSPWDISFMFAQPIIDNPNKVSIEQRVSVTMSLKAAKSLAELLDRTIKNHEKEFGEI